MTAFVNAYTLTSALGSGVEAMRKTLRGGQSALTDAPWPGSDVPCFLGRVDVPADLALPPAHRSRNNALVELALRQDAFAETVGDVRSGLSAERVGLVMGTSTSSIDRTEQAYCELDAEGRFAPAFRQSAVHNPHAPAHFAAERLGIAGPCITVSAACASGAKAFATAKRWLDQGLVDGVVVGAADSLCLSVIYGFHALQLVAPEPCRPFAADRQGISLGEAAGFALMTREHAEGALRLLGAGESCDAYHMSSADPEGVGARRAIEGALADATLDMADIDYVNLHGTGTRANDDIEGGICGSLIAGSTTLASGTKGWTGHALGAAGMVEAILCLDALATGLVPGTCNTVAVDAPFDLLLDSIERPLQAALSNSFGFGGSNCALVFAQ